MEATENILNISFYRFVGIDDPRALRDSLQAAGLRLGIKGTVLIASEGINGGVAGLSGAVESFAEILASDIRFKQTVFKRSYSSFVPFRRWFVKVKREILTLRDPDVDPRSRAPHYISPRALRASLERGERPVLIDVRNDFEVGYGTFSGALNPRTRSFGQFTAFARDLKIPKEQKVVTFCTGGIRCEKAEIILRRQGFQNVVQLEGGILEYFRQTDGRFFEGRCFVFDEREALDKNLKSSK